MFTKNWGNRKSWLFIEVFVKYFLGKVFEFKFRLGYVWLTLVIFTRLTQEIFVLTLFPNGTTTSSCFHILHLYHQTGVVTSFGKRIMALMPGGQTRNNKAIVTRADSVHQSLIVIPKLQLLDNDLWEHGNVEFFFLAISSLIFKNSSDPECRHNMIY